MPRIRTIKPEFFLHEGLADADAETGLPCRLAFIGLWCCADREGRFHWRPRRLKAQILPYDDNDLSRVLDALWTRGFIEKYERDGCEYGWIPGFADHQVINNRETGSRLPNPHESTVSTREARDNDASSTRQVHAQGEGKGREGNMEGKGTDTAPRSNGDATPPATPAFIALPLNDKSEHPVTEADVAHWQDLYPAVDVKQQLRNMRGWLDSNPAKRKTSRGIERFVTNWLSREQDRGGTRQGGGTQTSTGKIGRAMAAINGGKQ